MSRPSCSVDEGMIFSRQASMASVRDLVRRPGTTIVALQTGESQQMINLVR
jgi:hypothetical protein